VVIQNNLFSSTGLDSVIVCALTTNLKHARLPWNVLLKKGEANLPKQSVVDVSQLFTVDKRDLEEKIGTLTRQRIRQIFHGILMIIEPMKNYRDYT
jgi:mRNA interferase MazF